jgi:riboflavin kinase / FMN adenylyltransferase
VICLDWKEYINQDPRIPDNLALTIGVFDGIHVGHKILLDRVLTKATSSSLIPALISFYENPKRLMNINTYMGDIFSLRQKKAFLASLGIELLVLIDFSSNFGRIAGREFVDLLQDRGRLRYLAIGNNFRCGHGLDTDAKAIWALNDEKGIETDLVQEMTMHGTSVSSSRIRTAVATGDLVEAASLLGRNVIIDVSDVPTTPVGRSICYNVHAKHRLMPPDGRYPVMLRCSEEPRTIEEIVHIRNGTVSVKKRTDVTDVEFVTRRTTIWH